MKAWTDYPFAELQDIAGQEAPVRECEVLSYDGNKYCVILVEGVTVEVKAGYLYRTPGRYGEAEGLKYRDLRRLSPKLRMSRGKPAYKTISYRVYSADGLANTKAKTLRQAKKQCERWGVGSEIWRIVDTCNRNGIGHTVSDIYAVLE